MRAPGVRPRTKHVEETVGHDCRWNNGAAIARSNGDLSFVIARRGVHGAQARQPALESVRREPQVAAIREKQIEDDYARRFDVWKRTNENAVSHGKRCDVDPDAEGQRDDGETGETQRLLHSAK